MDYVKHVPGGGDVEIFNEKLKIKAKSKCGTFDNIKHKAGGGDVEIFHEKLPWKESDDPTFESGSMTIDSGSGKFGNRNYIS